MQANETRIPVPWPRQTQAAHIVRICATFRCRPFRASVSQGVLQLSLPPARLFCGRCAKLSHIFVSRELVMDLAAQWFFGAALASTAAIIMYALLMVGILRLYKLRLSQQKLESRISRGILCPQCAIVLVPLSCLSDATFDSAVRRELATPPPTPQKPQTT